MSIKTQRLLERAKKNAKKGKYDEAKSLYQEILKKTPDNSNLYSDEDIKQLKQLKVLFDEGILTSEEFKKAKKRILN